MPPIYRFGLFEVNSATRQLLRNGAKIRLQEQPFRVLLYLLESPGQLVTREQLRQNLWSGDIFVEFDNSLRVAVGKLRDALGDSADNPRFVETVPRLGYRFIAPVQVSATEPASVSLEDPDFNRSTPQALPAREVEVPAPIERRTRKILLWGFSVAAVLHQFGSMENAQSAGAGAE
jgi:DNA-binding winged helix-turn-helix (wHTH) protein